MRLPLILLLTLLGSLLSPPVFGQAASAPALPDGVPGIYGDVCCLDWQRTDIGRRVAWGYKRLDGSAAIWYVHCRHGVCDLGAWDDFLVGVKNASDPIAYAKAAMTSISTPMNCADPLNTPLCDETKTWLDTVVRPQLRVAYPVAASAPTPPASSPPPTPTTKVWIVTPSGTTLTRPAYPLLNGKRASAFDAQVRSRAPCDCSVGNKFSEFFGLVTYCKVNLADVTPVTTVPHVAACTEVAQ